MGHHIIDLHMPLSFPFYIYLPAFPHSANSGKGKDIEVVEESSKAHNRSKTSFKLRVRAVVELDALAKDLDRGCQSWGGQLKLSDCSEAIYV